LGSCDNWRTIYNINAAKLYIKFSRIDFVDEQGNCQEILPESARLETIFNSGELRQETELKIKDDGTFEDHNSVLLIKSRRYRFKREDKIIFSIN
jgi:hypothetical protein